MHEHPPARVVLDDRRGRADRTGALQRQRQGRLRGHHGHHPPPYGSPDIAISIIEHAAGAAHTTHREIRRSQHRITDRAQAPCQESWVPVRCKVFVGDNGGRVAHPAVDLAFCVVCRCRLREVRPLRRGGCCHRCRGAGDGVWVFSSWRGADSPGGAVGRWPGGRSGKGIGRHVYLQPTGGFPNCAGQRCWGGGATGCCRRYRRREFVRA